MSYGRYKNRSRSYARNIGSEAARRHIEEAREFSREIGGTDTDVKQYFFGLSGPALETIFTEYGKINGPEAEEYARNTFARWKRGSTQMSGLVAKRLFNLLPPRMPLTKKLELADNLWKHYGPSSSHYFTVGPHASISSVVAAIQAKVEAAIQNYVIPEQIRNRFDWLSGRDVQAKEQLLNYFRGRERELALATLKEQIPILQKQMSQHAGQTLTAKAKIIVQRHNVDVWIDHRLGETFREGQPARQNSSSASPINWVAVAILAAIVLFYLATHHH